MRSVILAALHSVRASLRMRAELQLEIVALCHQLGMLRADATDRGAV